MTAATSLFFCPKAVNCDPPSITLMHRSVRFWSVKYWTILILNILNLALILDKKYFQFYYGMITLLCYRKSNLKMYSCFRWLKNCLKLAYSLSRCFFKVFKTTHGKNQTPFISILNCCLSLLIKFYCTCPRTEKRSFSIVRTGQRGLNSIYGAFERSLQYCEKPFIWRSIYLFMN